MTVFLAIVSIVAVGTSRMPAIDVSFVGPEDIAADQLTLRVRGVDLGAAVALRREGDHWRAAFETNARPGPARIQLVVGSDVSKTWMAVLPKWSCDYGPKPSLLQRIGRWWQRAWDPIAAAKED